LIKLGSASKQTTQVVSSLSGTPFGVGTSHGHFGPQDSPRPGLRGCHHHPPYSIFCDAPWGLHPNGTNSRDSQVGVPKSTQVSRFWTLGLWEAVAPCPQLWSQRGLNRSCIPRRDLSNDVSHSRIGHRELVDSRLVVVGSQTGSLTPGPSFAHNLG